MCQSIQVSTLLDIWRDYRDDIEAELPMAPVLPEPPMVRESLCNHIRLLLESLKDKAKEEGRLVPLVQYEAGW